MSNECEIIDLETDLANAEERIATLEAERVTWSRRWKEAETENAKLREWQEKVFEAHPNVDLDLERLEKT
jgi:hypothetical protein